MANHEGNITIPPDAQNLGLTADFLQEAAAELQRRRSQPQVHGQAGRRGFAVGKAMENGLACISSLLGSVIQLPGPREVVVSERRFGKGGATEYSLAIGTRRFTEEQVDGFLQAPNEASNFLPVVVQAIENTRQASRIEITRMTPEHGDNRTKKSREQLAERKARRRERTDFTNKVQKNLLDLNNREANLRAVIEKPPLTPGAPALMIPVLEKPHRFDVVTYMTAKNISQQGVTIPTIGRIMEFKYALSFVPLNPVRIERIWEGVQYGREVLVGQFMDDVIVGVAGREDVRKEIDGINEKAEASKVPALPAVEAYLNAVIINTAAKAAPSVTGFGIVEPSFVEVNVGAATEAGAAVMSKAAEIGIIGRERAAVIGKYVESVIANLGPFLPAILQMFNIKPEPKEEKNGGNG